MSTMGGIGAGEAGNREEEVLETGVSSEEGSVVDGAPRDEASLPRPSSWAPTVLVFQQYEAMAFVTAEKAKLTQSSLIHRLTVNIKETFRVCNPSFSYSETLNPRCQIPLTNPSQGVSNDGLDNCNSDLILTVNGTLVNSEARRRYVIKEMLGQGTFGQVAKCWKDDTDEFVAVKVIKNQPAYYHQALVEISIVRMLNGKYDVDDKHHIVRIVDHFVFEHHLCIVFELLTYNLFELIKQNQFRGLSINLVRLFTKQLLDSLTILQDASVIHCDLKPENILLKSLGGEIKLIDFGSACLESRTVYSYIQSRFYRSPEVLLGHAYTTSIDMWSLGCVAAELFLGLPLFPGASEYDLLQRMLDTLGCQPPDHILRHAKQTTRFFKRKPGNQSSGQSVYTFLSSSEFEEREKAKPAAGKRYFKHTRLEDIVISYSLWKGITPEEIQREHEARLSFIHFLRGLVDFDPVRRWSPRQAATHPFITEEPFNGHWEPAPDATKCPPKTSGLSRENLKTNQSEAAISSQAKSATDQVESSLDHQQQQQQQLALQRQLQQQQQQQLLSSPQFSAAAQYSPYGISYGTSYGSYGSFGEGTGSYGSYNTDASANYFNYATPPTASSFNPAMAAASGHGSVIGLPGGIAATSPNRSRLLSMMSATPQTMSGLLGTHGGAAAAPPGAGMQSQLGMSPTMNAGFRPTSLGMSPSQFTPPGPQFHYPSGASPQSPVRYGGPTSPLRGATGIPVGGGPGPLALGKAAAVGQYNKRRGRNSAVHPVGSGGSLAGAMELAAAQARQQLQQQQSWTTSTGGDVSMEGQGRGLEGQSKVTSSLGAGERKTGSALLPRKPPLSQGNEASSCSLGFSQPAGGQGSTWVPGSVHGGQGQPSMPGGNDSTVERAEETSPPPDPGDWDPGYSDELLFEEEGTTADVAQGGEGSADLVGSGRKSLGPGQTNVASGGHGSQGQLAGTPPSGSSPTSWHRNGPLVGSPSQPPGLSSPSVQTAHSYSLGASHVANGGQYISNQYAGASFDGSPAYSTPYQPRQVLQTSQHSPYQQQQQFVQSQQQQQWLQQQYFQQQVQMQLDQHQAMLQHQQHGYSSWAAQGGGASQLVGSQMPLPVRDPNHAEVGTPPGYLGYNGAASGQVAGPYGTGSGNVYRHSSGGVGASGEYASMVTGAMMISGGQPRLGSGEWSSAYPMSPPDFTMVDAGGSAWHSAGGDNPIGQSPDARSSGLRKNLHGNSSPANGRPPPAMPVRRDNRRSS